MIRRTIAQLAAMSGAVPNEAAAAAGEAVLRGVSTDSRAALAGKLFAPLVGERFDGHDYVESAFAGGAGAALWQADRPVPAALADKPLLLADDTLAALQRLAAAYRLELPVRIVGITGSNGKTSTKDMAAAVLAAGFKTHKTEGNLRSEERRVGKECRL